MAEKLTRARQVAGEYQSTDLHSNTPRFQHPVAAELNPQFHEVGEVGHIRQDAQGASYETMSVARNNAGMCGVGLKLKVFGSDFEIKVCTPSATP